MATAAIETTLLADIKANLQDATNHAEAAAIFNRKVKLLPVLMPLNLPAPYAIVVPGSSVGDSAGPVEHLTLQVQVWIVISILNDPENETVLESGAMLDDAATLCRVVRDALVRPEPYRGSPYDASPYTEAPGVVTCVHLGTGPLEALEVDASDGGVDIYLARPMTFEYEIWEG